MAGRTKLTRQAIIPNDEGRRLSRLLFLLCITAMLAGTVDAIRWTVSAERDDLRRANAVANERARIASERARIAEQELMTIEARQRAATSRANAKRSLEDRHVDRAERKTRALEKALRKEIRLRQRAEAERKRLERSHPQPVSCL